MATIFLRDNAQRNKMAYGFILAMVIVSFISLFSEITGVIILNKLIAGDFLEDATLDLFDNSIQAIRILYIITFVGAIITFIMWFRRAYYNVHEFALSPPQYSEGWAAGAWFLPILSLFRPSQIMKEIWFETIAFLRNKTSNCPIEVPTGKLNLWWGTWVVGSMLGNISSRLYSDSAALYEMLNGYYLDVAMSIFILISGFTLLQIIKEYGALEKELHIVENEVAEDSIFYEPTNIETEY